MSYSVLLKRGVLPAIVVSSSAVLGLGYYSKHTILLQNYKNYIALKRDDEYIEPSDRLKNMVNDVSEDLKDVISKYTKIVPYMMPGIHTWRAGTIGTMQGGIIGLPVFFEYSSKEDVVGKFLVKSKDGPHSDEEICECLLLSDKAKKYAIAREILHINTIQVPLDSALPIIIAFGMEHFSRSLFVIFKVQNLSQTFRGLFYTIIVLFSLLIWRFLHGNLRNYFESEVQHELTKLGEDYLEGGVEHLTKAMKRESISVELKDQNRRALQVVDEAVNAYFGRMKFSSSELIAYLKAHVQSQKNPSSQK